MSWLLAASSTFSLASRSSLGSWDSRQVYKHIAPVGQSDLEFLISADNNTHINLDIKLYIRGKLISGNGKELDATDFTAVTNNFLHSLFSQCNITLNGVPNTQACELYHYRSYLETLMTHGSDDANTHLTNSFWYLGSGDMVHCDATMAQTYTTNKGLITRLNRIKQINEVEIMVDKIATFVTCPSI